MSFYHRESVSPPLPAVRLSGKQVLLDLQWLLFECSERCMTDAVKWASEVAAYCSAEMYKEYEECEEVLDVSENHNTISFENRHVVLGRSLLACQDLYRAIDQFDRVRHLNHTNLFLYYWSRYLANARVALENEAETIEKRGTDTVGKGHENTEMAQLHTDLLKERQLLIDESPSKKEPHCDIFMEFLLGRVELTLGEREMAVSRFTECVKREPRFWPAYECLVSQMHTETQIADIVGAPGEEKKCWMQYWFESLALSHVQHERRSIEAAHRLAEAGMSRQPMIIAHIASMKSELFENEACIDLFTQLLEMEPNRIEKMERYAEALFVSSNRVKLSNLAHRFFKTHKFKWETCMIVANYYSMRADHETAIKFLHRANKLNPYSSRCWTLIGHEFMELKNNPAACLAYRKATELDPKDASGFYGLGSMYDILKMHTYALHYYQMAHKCRPQDSRMLVALGECFMKINKLVNAERCFMKAYKVGDVEGIALIGLARLYENSNQDSQAVKVYEKYLNQYREDETHLPTCYIFLAKYYYKTMNFEAARMYAIKCQDYDQIRDEGAALLREANAKRGGMWVKQEVEDEDAQETEMVLSDGEDNETFD